MPAVTVPTPKISTDPGYLFYAPLGTAEPAHTVSGSVFTDAWPAAWLLLGATEEGHNFSWSTSVETIDVAEFLDPIKYVSTGRTGSVAFALASITAANVKRALNGGTLTQTGGGASPGTELNTYTPPKLGEEVRCMIGWESQDSTERLLAYQCFNTGTVSIARRKGAAKATIPVEFALEQPSTGDPFKYLTAGTDRA
jgi:hypothetical protein